MMGKLVNISYLKSKKQYVDIDAVTLLENFKFPCFSFSQNKGWQADRKSDKAFLEAGYMEGSQ